MAMPLKPTPLKHCGHCGVPLERKRLKNGQLESLLHFGRRKFCARACMAKSYEKEFSTAGPSAARSMARRRKPKGPCEKCGKPLARDVHHANEVPQDNRPENLVRICRSCHNREHSEKGLCVLCGQPQKGLGYCDKHYQRFKKHGDPLAVKANQFRPVLKEGESLPPKTCSFPGCGKPFHANGLCGRHAMQARRGRLGLERTQSEAVKASWIARRAKGLR